MDTTIHFVLHHYNEILIAVGIYILTAFLFIGIASTVRRGFQNLKKFSEHGLIYWLSFGLVFGPAMVLMFGSFDGIMNRLLGGLIIGLFLGLIWGWISEFWVKAEEVS